jgi:polyhydroxybutyrate depolymerase
MHASNTSVKNRLAVIFPLVLGLFLGGCMASLPPHPGAGPRTYKNYMGKGFNGVRRSYLVHVPAGYDPAKPVPLVVVIHGAFDTAGGIEKISGFSALADREKFVALYPNGMGLFGFLQHWNAGFCCGKAAEDNWDDVGFLSAVIEDVRARLKIDARRIYMVGFSNGGMLTYRFAAERGGILAAAAPMAASIGGRPSEDAPEWRIPKPANPVAMLIVHGLADDDVPYKGGVSRHRGGTRTYLSVEASVGFWVTNNGCEQRRADRYVNDGRVRLESWGNCRDDADVTLVLIKGWGHIWPGPYFTSELAKTDPLRGFDAAEIIWAFFKSHHLGFAKK